MRNFLKHYWLELLITVTVWMVVGWQMGVSALVLTLILSVLEITLSADNAVVNSRVLLKMSPFWQKMFLTVGIVIAVFAVRFALPIAIVALTTSLGVGSVLDMALNDSAAYGEHLLHAAPLIDGFGGMFLLLVALFFFVDKERERHVLWLTKFERILARWARFSFTRPLIVMLIFLGIVLCLPSITRLTVTIAMAVGIITFLGMYGITLLMERFGDKERKGHQAGLAAFGLFMYLQVLDASFSLDGVVGAFALTTNIMIIMAGLGIGALWVRTMTLYMVRHNTLAKYRFIESGAHWAILALAAVMLLKLFHVELPELIVGTIGLVFISGSIYSSIQRPHNK